MYDLCSVNDSVKVSEEGYSVKQRLSSVSWDENNNESTHYLPPAGRLHSVSVCTVTK